MENLATPAEMVEDILHSPDLQHRISADAFIGLLQMAHEQEKNRLQQQAEQKCKKFGYK